MADANKIGYILTTQSDILTMTKEELIEKYTTNSKEFRRFIEGLASLLNSNNYEYYFSLKNSVIYGVLAEGKEKFSSEIDGDKSLVEKYNSLELFYKGYGATFIFGTTEQMQQTNRDIEKYKKVQASLIGVKEEYYDNPFKEEYYDNPFLVILPEMFKQLMGEKTETDYSKSSFYMNAIAYIALTFPEFAASSEFDRIDKFLNDKEGLKERINSSLDPRGYRKAVLNAKIRVKAAQIQHRIKIGVQRVKTIGQK